MTLHTQTVGLAPNPNGTYVGGVMGSTQKMWTSSSLTYSFPASGAVYGSNYPVMEGGLLGGGSKDLDATQQAFSSGFVSALRGFMDKDDGNNYNNALAIEGFTNLTISEAGTPANANLRGSFADLISGAGGVAYGPRTYDDDGGVRTGDYWIDDAYVSNSYETGTYLLHATQHEIGHALGL